MPRPPRHEAPDVVYHAIWRGCRGQPIFETLSDKEHFAYLLKRITEEFEWRILNWVFMTNHHHLVVRLSKPNLSRGMQQLHGLFGQRWNERHESSGHVFFRRYTSIPVLKWEYAATLTTYLDLNPVRAGLCRRPGEWQWSGYSAIVGRKAPMPFHDAAGGLRMLITSIDDPPEARLAYARTVNDRAASVHRRGASADERPTLSEILVDASPEQLREATELWWYSARDVARHLGISPTTVCKRMREVDKGV